MNPTLPPLAELLQRTNDPSVLLPVAWWEAATGKLDPKVASQLAGSLELARATTPDRIAALCKLSSAIVAEFGADAAGFAGLLHSHAIAISRIGYVELGVRLFEVILTTYERYAPPANLANALMNKASALQSQGKLVEAVVGYDQALPLLEQHASPAEFALCLMNRASALQGQGKLIEGVAGYDQALPLLKQHAPPAEFALCLMNRAIAVQELGELAEAVAEFDRALHVLERHGAPANVANGLMNRANAHREQGKLAEAVAGYDRALPLFEQHAPTTEFARCLMNRANALQAQGKSTEAVAGFDRALLFLERYAPPVEFARCLMNRAIALQSQGKLVEAVAGYDQALPLLEQHASPAEFARCIANRASTLREQGKLAEAVAGYDRALPLFEQHAPTTEVARCLMNRAIALQDLGELTEAATEFDRALPSLERYAPPADLARCLTNKANVLRELRRYPESAAAYAQARWVLRQSRLHAGTDDTNLEFRAQFDPLYDGGVRAGLEGGLRDAAYDSVREGKAGVFDDIAFKRARLRGAEPQEVLDARKALTHCLRNEVPELPEGAPLTEDATRQFAECVAKFQQGRAERTKRYFSEWGQHANAYDSGRAALPSVEDLPTRTDVQKELADGWAVVDFWRSEKDEFHVFIVTRDDFEVVKVPFPIESAKSGFEVLLPALRDITTEPNLGGLLDLGALLQPLVKDLREKGVKGLYLVPHSYLHGFPLHAACWYENDKQTYLCDAFDVAYLPSANLLPRLPRIDCGGGAFVMANPETGTRHSLPMSEAEGRQMQKLFAVPPERCFFGAEATCAATAHWGDCGLVHYTGHGLGDANFGSLSHLRLADDLLLAHDVLYRAPALRSGAVVLLNGCETAVHDWRAVSESMGLMSAFLNRGAASVFCTQWSVYDMCAAPMALTFAKRVRAGATPMAAFNAARAALRNMPLTAATADTEQAVKGFAPNTPERAHALGQLAWLYAQTGRRAEARRAATEAAPAFRAMGMARRADALLARATGKDDWPQWARDFDNPAFWGAFQLVGRAV
jgi:tetratricopeptide (TPR) repeat protein/CHAT domain-containing protein